MFIYLQVEECAKWESECSQLCQVVADRICSSLPCPQHFHDQQWQRRSHPLVLWHQGSSVQKTTSFRFRIKFKHSVHHHDILLQLLHAPTVTLTDMHIQNTTSLKFLNWNQLNHFFKVSSIIKNKTKIQQ